MGAYSERLHRLLLHPNETVVARDPDADRRAALKGKFDGNCNRTACQVPILGKNWFNTSTLAYYCTACARLLNRESMRFEAIDICVPVKTADEQPPFPYEKIRRRS
jgi:hypothetical protein